MSQAKPSSLKRQLWHISSWAFGKPVASGFRGSWDCRGVAGRCQEGLGGIPSCSVTRCSACQEWERVVARNAAFWEATRAHSSLLFGGNISSFYRGSILFSYRFFNKDTFLSEIPVISHFPSQQWELWPEGLCKPWCWTVLHLVPPLPHNPVTVRRAAGHPGSQASAWTSVSSQWATLQPLL